MGACIFSTLEALSLVPHCMIPDTPRYDPDGPKLHTSGLVSNQSQNTGPNIAGSSPESLLGVVA